jgi:hypothetical protein
MWGTVSASSMINIVPPMRAFVPFFLAFVNTVFAGEPAFAAHELATDLKGGYQVVVADVNGDGKPDLIALASGMPDLVWFENPSWKRHILATGFNRMINCAFEEVDGKPFAVLAHEFNNDASKSLGVVSVLTPDGDRTLPWKAREIDRYPTSHRIRVIKLDGKSVFLNTPLTNSAAVPPEYRGDVPIFFYRPGIWKREVVPSQEQGVLHGVWVEEPNSFLVASFLGIHRYRLKDGHWNRTEVSPGDPSPWPKSGSSDVTESGSLTAAIEPWHGNQVVVYDHGAKSRKIIDTSLVDGHTILAADFGGDHTVQIVAGYRGGGGGVNLYSLSKDGEWKRTVLDSHMAAAACAVADLNGDGRLDLACIGSSTSNLKWYESLRAR